MYVGAQGVVYVGMYVVCRYVGCESIGALQVCSRPMCGFDPRSQNPSIFSLCLSLIDLCQLTRVLEACH